MQIGVGLKLFALDTTMLGAYTVSSLATKIA